MGIFYGSDNEIPQTFETLLKNFTCILLEQNSSNMRKLCMDFRILVVDDEKNVRAGLAEAMKMDGYDIVQAEDGQTALKTLLKTEIDLVIADSPYA